MIAENFAGPASARVRAFWGLRIFEGKELRRASSICRADQAGGALLWPRGLRPGMKPKKARVTRFPHRAAGYSANARARVIADPQKFLARAYPKTEYPPRRA